MQAENFWDHPEDAQKIMDERNSLKAWTVPFQEMSQKLSEISEFYPEAQKENEQSLLEEMGLEVVNLEKKVAELEVKKMLGGELDPKDCYLEINAGAGGTESCDWAEMLARMYQRWATKRGWKLDIVDRVEGEVAGIKSITYKISGDFCYGFCKSEKGVHRLVRISPFDANAKRHTSFASVDVTPIIDDKISITVRSEDIRIDTYRASGAGGQHVNKTDSAVRMTHHPTGIVVSCQNQKSQIQNREACMKLLKSKLYEMEVIKREQEIRKLGGEKKDIAWGSQIRNYVFQPYTLVKDTRTKIENGNIQAVMDGDLDDFVYGYLKEFA